MLVPSLRGFAVSLALAFASSAQSGQPEPTLAAPPPPLAFHSWVLPSEDPLPQWESLRGKTVVLEFWATWCGACIPALGHLEKACAEAGGELVVLAISDEPAEKQAPHARKHPGLRFVRDDADKTFHAFDPKTIPHTVIVGPDGLVKAITEPTNVTAQALRSVQKGEAIALPRKGGRRANAEWDMSAPFNPERREPCFLVILEPTQCQSGGSWYQPGKRRLTADGLGLATLLGIAFEKPYTRVETVLSKKLLEQTWRASIWVPEDKVADLRDTVVRAVGMVAQIDARLEPRERDCFVMKCAPGRQGKPSTAKPGGIGFGRGAMSGDGVTVAALAIAVENFAGKPIVDETGITDRIDVDLHYDVSDFSVLRKNLETGLGFVLEPARRGIETLVLREKGEPR